MPDWLGVARAINRHHRRRLPYDLLRVWHTAPNRSRRFLTGEEWFVDQLRRLGYFT